ncbi:MAG: pentapeptide repeat-containing protein [Phycisphaerales bacterium]
MEIADLRALIESVSRVWTSRAPSVGSGVSVSEVEQRCTWAMSVARGCVLEADCSGLSELGELRFDGCLFHCDVSFRHAVFSTQASFQGTTFAGNAWFDRARFCGGLIFDSAVFGGTAGFAGVRVDGDARFVSIVCGGIAEFRGAAFSKGADFADAVFVNSVRFEGATFDDNATFSAGSFGGSAEFVGVRFRRDAVFRGARFSATARFGGAGFLGSARFGETMFSGDAEFVETRFELSVGFSRADFAAGVKFEGARFAKAAVFREARFARDAKFSAARCEGTASFEKSTFAGSVDFSGTSFAEEVNGDLRLPLVRAICAASLIETRRAFLPPIRWRGQAWKDRWALIRRIAGTLFHRIPAYAHHGWSLVRALGSLTILNRVSLVALVGVPIIASFYLGAQHLAREAHTHEADGRWVVRLLAAMIRDEPHMSRTLALAFLAAVLVTLGLLIYQLFADDAIKKNNEDDHEREFSARYPEGSAQRNDGLRRAMEQIEDQARKRWRRHPTFVRHHGEWVWLPSHDELQWFDDSTLPTLEELKRKVAEVYAKCRPDDKIPEIEDPRRRAGFLSGVERARICMEEGARADYWLRAHKNWGAALLSALFYFSGIAVLLFILYLQCAQVYHAAGGWDVMFDPKIKQSQPADPPSPKASPPTISP